jgi:hypothetical protein
MPVYPGRLPEIRVPDQHGPIGQRLRAGTVCRDSLRLRWVLHRSHLGTDDGVVIRTLRESIDRLLPDVVSFQRPVSAPHVDAPIPHWVSTGSK